MTTYLVLKPMKEDRRYLPGETVVDPPRADRLRERGYLTIVPDDYSGQSAEEIRPPTVEEALVAGYSPEAAEALSQGKHTPEIDAETEALEASLNADPDAPPTEDELKATAAGLSDDDLDAAIDEYSIEVAADASRPDKEAALVKFTLEHPEAFQDDDVVDPSDVEQVGAPDPVTETESKPKKNRKANGE